MRNDTRNDKPEHLSGSQRKSGKGKSRTAGRRNPGGAPPQHTAGERERMRTGLRILARIIARVHLNRQAFRSAPAPPEPGAGD